MDLSSLEGPPILDRDPQSTHLNALPSLGLPPRPASADAVAHMYTSQIQPRYHPRPHSQYQSQSQNLTPQSSLPPHYRRARTPSPTPLARYPPRAQSRSTSSHQLIWVEAEKTWAVVSRERSANPAETVYFDFYIDIYVDVDVEIIGTRRGAIQRTDFRIEMDSGGEKVKSFAG
ncbi:uncharacterized protein ATNIH1004_008922 [Aspergillus tanneri]|uniref:Uncharacterized protein n=1 Tax=Aspergillus tanneri TaxID=1220188 RepID=A0A5M9MCK4_9EURO|nr:uncharacterized protein ATNIH1004_008922 [Aspergillus tanneri]KAA8644715.1 hypothetical protein ATNIH1004_008922 [Aspergillus tanneri]